MIAPNPFYVDRGFSVRVYNQAKGLAGAGHKVLVAAYGAGRDIDCAEIARAPGLPGYGEEALGAKLSRLYLDFFLFFTSLFAALRFRPDIIHGHLHEGGLIGLVVGRLLGVPALLDAQGGLASELRDRGTVSSGLLLKLARAMEGFIYRRSDFIIYSAPAVGGEITGAFGINPGKTAQLGDAVDAAGFSAAPAFPREKFGLRPEDRVAVYVGTLHKYYGTDCLLEAAAIVKGRLPGARFLVCGGPDAEGYGSRARELGLDKTVVFTGRTRYEEMPRYLAAADAAVAPKLSGSEGNQKILAYMAFGLPVVCFDTPANRQMLGGLGRYAAAATPAALAEKLIEVLGDPGENRELKEQMRAHARENYSVEASAAKLLEIYGRLKRP